MNNKDFRKKIKSILKKDKRKKIFDSNQSQVINFFSTYHNEIYYETENTDLNLIKFHWPDRKFYLNKYLKKDGLVMDAGCGGGAIGKSFFKGYEKKTNYVGVDKSNNLHNIKKRGYQNAFGHKVLIEDISFKKNSFDIILCHGVLHHIKNYKKSLIKLLYVLKKNGILFLTVNKTLPFILNLHTNDLKKKISRMPKKTSILLLKNITELGKSLRKIDKKVFIDKKLQHLNIPKGKYKVHDLVHYYIFRNFYNSAWPFRASFNQNQDWYYPHISHNLDVDKIENIFKKCKMKILKKYSPSPSADCYIIRKII